MNELLCWAGLHSWSYIENYHGGKPMNRKCRCCGTQQTWDYDIARQHGAIKWIALNNE